MMNFFPEAVAAVGAVTAAGGCFGADMLAANGVA